MHAQNRLHIYIAMGLILLLFGQMILSAIQKAPTYDEQGYIARGYALVKLGDLHIRIGTPILLNALNALPLIALPDVRLPVDAPSWSGTDFHPIGERFMWRVNENADQILLLARVPTMMLALLLAVFVYRWAREMFGPWGGMLSLALCAFDPNVIAHGQLATTDLGSAALLFIATYWAWKLLSGVRPRWPAWANALVTGVFFGLAQASKFSSLLFGPIFALLFLWRATLPRPFTLQLPFARSFAAYPLGQRWPARLRWLLFAGLLIVIVAGLTLWAVYGFQVGPIPETTSWPVPAPAHLEQFLDISGRLSGAQGREAPAFLMGQHYEGGRWDYFCIAFLIKTPIPTLICLVGAISLTLSALCLHVRRNGIPPYMRRNGIPVQVGRNGSPIQVGRNAIPTYNGHTRRGGYVLWLPPIIYLGFSLTSKLNLGYRYLLPALPFVLVIAGRTGEWLAQNLSQLGGQRRAMLVAATSILIGWSAWSGLTIYPHYLAYFNEWVGGPDNGWRYLVDSNIDWGQDLKGLRRWMEANGVQRIKLGYFGEAYPSYYGIHFDPLPSYPDRWQHPLYHDLYPHDPAPGLYAISATLLQGVNAPDPDTYAWFREREPLDKVGYSIFIYDVPSRGKAAILGLSGLAPADVRPQDYALLGTNDVRVLWFDAQRAAVFPLDHTDVFLLLAGDATIHPALGPLWPSAEEMSLTTRDGRPLRMLSKISQTTFQAHVAALAPGAPVWHLPAARFVPGDPANHGERLSYPIQFGDQVQQCELLAYEILGPAADRSFGSAQDRSAFHPGETLTAITFWRVRAASEEPLKLFVHLLDADSAYVGGQDRLDVWYDNWRPGDLVAQVHQVEIGDNVVSGEYQVEIGWYHSETMQRLPVIQDGKVIADRVLLNAVRVE